MGTQTPHGFIERTREIVDQQALVGQHFDDPAKLQSTLDQRVAFLNTHYRSRALNGQAPLTAHPEAAQFGSPLSA